jgi:hypothetical protein
MSKSNNNFTSSFLKGGTKPDKLINFYELMDKEMKNDTKRDKNFKNHFIEPCSMILAIGGTGSGKSLALLNLLQRKNEAFYKLIIFSGSSTNEPAYNLIREKMPDAEFYEDIDELPALNDEEDTEHEKLIVFDDFINMKKKDFQKIKDYLISGRKKKWTVYLNAQNYTDVPKTITRNCHYFLIFKQNDNATINNMLKNHNINNTNKEDFKNMYFDATKEKPNFFTVDIKGGSLRKNFTEFYTNKII